MSQQNVDLVLESYDAFNRRDLDAYLALIDPEVELTPRIMELEGGSYYRGHDGVREWWRTLFAVFPDFSSEIVEVRDLGDSLIIAVRVRGHGVEGGPRIGQSGAGYCQGRCSTSTSRPRPRGVARS